MFLKLSVCFISVTLHIVWLQAGRQKRHSLCWWQTPRFHQALKHTVHIRGSSRILKWQQKSWETRLKVWDLHCSEKKNFILALPFALCNVLSVPQPFLNSSSSWGFRTSFGTMFWRLDILIEVQLVYLNFHRELFLSFSLSDSQGHCLHRGNEQHGRCHLSLCPSSCISVDIWWYF